MKIEVPSLLSQAVLRLRSASECAVVVLTPLRVPGDLLKNKPCTAQRLFHCSDQQGSEFDSARILSGNSSLRGPVGSEFNVARTICLPLI